MDSCDVLIVGAGPAGSSCAWGLRDTGLDIRVVDRKPFPRDKVCAGWITPQVVEALELDLADFTRENVCQPITGFRTGLIGGRDVVNRYDRPVSYGIRRCEFDQYLRRRTPARHETWTIESLDQNKLFIFHINDAEDLPKERLTDAHRLYPGTGILPLREIKDRFDRIGYNRMVSVEIFRPEYWQQDPFDVAHKAKAATESALGLGKYQTGGSW